MISGLSKLADKSFIIGFALPAIVLLIATSFLFPEFPAAGAVRDALLPASSKKLDDLVFFIVTTWLVALLLNMANNVQYKVLEGYLPPVSWVPAFRRRRLDEYALMKLIDETLTKAWALAIKRKWQFAFVDAVQMVREQRLLRYPKARSHVLPTRFGNRIRAFEMYAMDVYGATPIATWIRLGMVLPREAQSGINDARSYVDFLVNMVYIGIFFALAAAVKAVTTGVQAHYVFAPGVLTYAGISVLALVVSMSAYEWAIHQTGLWGELVKSAFDCYLPGLAKQLGYTVPANPGAQRGFWSAFNQVMIYRDVSNVESWLAKYADATAAIPGARDEPKQPAAPDAEANGEDSPDAGDPDADDDDPPD